MAELTYKQRLFVDYYLGESQGNATDAARRAGLSSPEVQSSRLLRNVKVRTAIDSRLESSAMHSKEVLARLSEIASGSLDEFLDIPDKGDWSLDLKRAKRHRKLGLLKKVKLRRETRFEPGPNGKTKEPVITDQLEIEIHDPLAALDKLARFHGLYERKQESTDVLNELEESDRIADAFDQGEDSSISQEIKE